jgi:hypothetical protein
VLGQALRQWGRNGDYSVSTPQRDELKPFIKPIASPTTSESVHRADSRDAMCPCNRSPDQIGVVTVGVYNAGLKPRDERAQCAVLPKITPCPNYYARDRNAKRFQLFYERVIVCGAGLEYRADMH